MLRALVIVVLVVHGLIHLLGPASAFGSGVKLSFQRPVSHGAGLMWGIAALFMLTAAVLLLLNWRLWWVPALPAVILSQALIFLWRRDGAFELVDIAYNVDRLPGLW